MMNATKFGIDGKLATVEDFARHAKQSQVVYVPSGEEAYLFSTNETFEKAMDSSGMRDQHQERRRRFNKAQDSIERIGREKAEEILSRMQAKLDDLSENIRELTSKVRTTDVGVLQELSDNHGGLALLNALVSPKIGTVKFYKDSAYRNSFNDWNGFFHISNNYVGNANNDKMSSIHGLAGIILFEHKNWQGRTCYLQGSFSVADLTVLGFNDIVSSYFFWA